ncbi:MAG: IS1380 family transposase, partial [Acidimicrobiia bacterium]
MGTVTHDIDRIAVVFDDDNAVVAPGLLLAATLITRLRLESLINTTVKIPGRAGGTLPGRKVLTIVATLLAGGTHIDHADLLRSGDTHKVRA